MVFYRQRVTFVRIISGYICVCQSFKLYLKMKKASEILGQISSTVLWKSGIDIIEQAQKEAYNEAIQDAVSNFETKFNRNTDAYDLCEQSILKLLK